MSTLAQRIEAIERELSDIKAAIQNPSVPKDWRSTFGTAKDDPEFEEIVRLGREIRESEREQEH